MWKVSIAFVRPTYFVCHFGGLTYEQNLSVDCIKKRVIDFSDTGLSHTTISDKGSSVPCDGMELCKSISHANDTHLAHLTKMFCAKGCSFQHRYQWTQAMKEAIDNTSDEKSMDPSTAIINI